jgi:hypothetical protein
VRHYEYWLGRKVQEAAARMCQGTTAVATDHLWWRYDAAGAVLGLDGLEAERLASRFCEESRDRGAEYQSSAYKLPPPES